MERAANEPVGAQFASQRSQFGGALLQNGVGYTARATKTGDDPAYGGHFYLCRGIAHQIHIAASNRPLHAYPVPVHRNACPLPFEWFKSLLFEEAIETDLGVTAMLADDAHRRSLG